MPLQIVAASLLLLTMGAGCSNPRSAMEQNTEGRVAAQYEFENAYIDVDDPD